MPGYGKARLPIYLVSQQTYRQPPGPSEAYAFAFAHAVVVAANVHTARDLVMRAIKDGFWLDMRGHRHECTVEDGQRPACDAGLLNVEAFGLADRQGFHGIVSMAFTMTQAEA